MNQTQEQLLSEPAIFRVGRLAKWLTVTSISILFGIFVWAQFTGAIVEKGVWAFSFVCEGLYAFFVIHVYAYYVRFANGWITFHALGITHQRLRFEEVRRWHFWRWGLSTSYNLELKTGKTSIISSWIERPKELEQILDTIVAGNESE